jgi:CheY-specific phosphatase CheX
MISNRAQNSFDQMLMQGIQACLGSSASESCEISVLPNTAEVRESKVVVLTVASYLFRLLVLIYFSPDESTKAHFARINNIEPADFTDQAFQDAIRECGNICCGTLNRELARVYPHVAMSTPNIIERECVNYLESLHGGHLRHLRAIASDGKQWHFSVCVRDYADIDFEWAVEEAATSAGEMEFF